MLIPVVLYECKTWSLTLRVSENKVLSRIFRPSREDVTVQDRIKLHSEEFHEFVLFNKYYWGDQIKEDDMDRKRDIQETNTNFKSESMKERDHLGDIIIGRLKE
jgi:hypothetical protein